MSSVPTFDCAMQKLGAPREGASISRLLDGRALLCCGIKGDDMYVTGTEIFDPVDNPISAGSGASPMATAPSLNNPSGGGTWRMGPRMHPCGIERFGCSQSTMADGRVLICGGCTNRPDDATEESDDACSHELRNVIVYNPRGDRWSEVSPMRGPRQGCSQSTLASGLVMVCGGFDVTGPLATVEVYDPQYDVWTASPPMRTARFNCAQVTLADGRVLVTGGHNGEQILASCETYDPTRREWAPAPSLHWPRYCHSISAQSDGRAVVCGGESGPDGAAIDTTEGFDPTTEAWAPLAPLRVARRGCAQTTLQDDRILVCGGSDGTTVLATSEILGGLDLVADRVTLYQNWLTQATVARTAAVQTFVRTKEAAEEEFDRKISNAKAQHAAGVAMLNSQLAKAISSATAQRDQRVPPGGDVAIKQCDTVIAMVRRILHIEEIEPNPEQPAQLPQPTMVQDLPPSAYVGIATHADQGVRTPGPSATPLKQTDAVSKDDVAVSPIPTVRVEDAPGVSDTPSRPGISPSSLREACRSLSPPKEAVKQTSTKKRGYAYGITPEKLQALTQALAPSPLTVRGFALAPPPVRGRERSASVGAIDERAGVKIVIARARAAASDPKSIPTEAPSSIDRPDDHICSITGHVMVDPVRVVDCGDTFDRVAIETWFETHERCPECDMLVDKAVVPNRAVKVAIWEWHPIGAPNDKSA